MKYAKMKVKYATLNIKHEYYVNMQYDTLYMYKMLHMKHECQT